MQHTQHHAVNWFEIPVRDIDRAQAFYEALLAAPLRRESMGPHTLAVFGYDETGVGGVMCCTGIYGADCCGVTTMGCVSGAKGRRLGCVSCGLNPDGFSIAIRSASVNSAAV